jgi:hypothetical protein
MYGHLGPTLRNSVGAPRKSRRQKHILRDRVERAKAVSMVAQVAPSPEPTKAKWTRENKIGVVGIVLSGLIGIVGLLLGTPEGRNLIHRPSDRTPENHSEAVRPTVMPSPPKEDQLSGEAQPRPQTGKRMKRPTHKLPTR